MNPLLLVGKRKNEESVGRAGTLGPLTVLEPIRALYGSEEIKGFGYRESDGAMGALGGLRKFAYSKNNGSSFTVNDNIVYGSVTKTATLHDVIVSGGIFHFPAYRDGQLWIVKTQDLSNITTGLLNSNTSYQVSSSDLSQPPEERIHFFIGGAVGSTLAQLAPAAAPIGYPIRGGNVTRVRRLSGKYSFTCQHNGTAKNTGYITDREKPILMNPVEGEYRWPYQISSAKLLAAGFDDVIVSAAFDERKRRFYILGKTGQLAFVDVPAENDQKMWLGNFSLDQSFSAMGGDATAPLDCVARDGNLYVLGKNRLYVYAKGGGWTVRNLTDLIARTISGTYTVPNLTKMVETENKLFITGTHGTVLTGNFEV